mmetsp:Transcript_41041/g.131252  ORF Transcript_41041/g.131252 Transcript_41041/m.131252 type:complete len:538 (-) Transcript_41041:167-1780(-)
MVARSAKIYIVNKGHVQGRDRESMVWGEARLVAATQVGRAHTQHNSETWGKISTCSSSSPPALPRLGRRPPPEQPGEHRQDEHCRGGHHAPHEHMHLLRRRVDGGHLAPPLHQLPLHRLYGGGGNLGLGQRRDLGDGMGQRRDLGDAPRVARDGIDGRGLADHGLLRSCLRYLPVVAVVVPPRVPLLPILADLGRHGLHLRHGGLAAPVLGDARVDDGGGVLPVHRHEVEEDVGVEPPLQLGRAPVPDLGALVVQEVPRALLHRHEVAIHVPHRHGPGLERVVRHVEDAADHVRVHAVHVAVQHVAVVVYAHPVRRGELELAVAPFLVQRLEQRRDLPLVDQLDEGRGHVHPVDGRGAVAGEVLRLLVDGAHVVVVELVQLLADRLGRPLYAVTLNGVVAGDALCDVPDPARPELVPVPGVLGVGDLGVHLQLELGAEVRVPVVIGPVRGPLPRVEQLVGVDLTRFHLDDTVCPHLAVRHRPGRKQQGCKGNGDGAGGEGTDVAARASTAHVLLARRAFLGHPAADLIYPDISMHLL